MRKGFTLLELLTVVMIIAILAIIAIPQFFRVAERGRSSEATNVLGTLRSSQLRYYAEHSANYATSIADLDVDVPTDNGDYKYFNAPNVAVSGQASMTRKNAGASIGNYTITIDYDDGDFTCSDGGASGTCQKLGM